MANLFNNLESSDPLTVEESKKDLTKTFSQSTYEKQYFNSFAFILLFEIVQIIVEKKNQIMIIFPFSKRFVGRVRNDGLF